MEKDKLIEKLKEVKEKLKPSDTHEYNETQEWNVWLSINELDLILTSLTAPVPDGKEERENIIMTKYIEKVGYGMDLFSECEIETITTILDILEDLTKTPDAG